MFLYGETREVMMHVAGLMPFSPPPDWTGDEMRLLMDEIRDGAKVELQSKAGQPLARYFPDLVASFRELAPNKFVLGNTLERVHLPIREGRPCYAARIEGRSSFARVGLLVHFTAPTIHAGFEGTITLEMINLAEYPISLFQGMEICQLIFESVGSTPFTNPSEFHGQSTPAGR